MGKIHFLFCMMIFWCCSDSPNEVPLDSYRSVVFNVNMNNVLNTIYSSEDSVSLIINDFEAFEMIDEDGDNILSITIPNMILGKTYSYFYAVNNTIENLDAERTITINDNENMVSDYYQEMNPTLVSFFVNMSYQISIGNFNLETDYLDIAGNFNGWDGEDYHLVQGENNIFEIIIPGLGAGDEIEYKFRINGDWELAEFPGGGPNRVYIVLNGNNVIELWYSDEQG